MISLLIITVLPTYVHVSKQYSLVLHVIFNFYAWGHLHILIGLQYHAYKFIHVVSLFHLQSRNPLYKSSTYLGIFSLVDGHWHCFPV